MTDEERYLFDLQGYLVIDDVLKPDELGVSTASTVKTLKVEAPTARSAGIKVGSVDELVDKLKNQAKVI